MPNVLQNIGNAIGGGLGLLRDQLGYEWNQIRGGLGAMGRGDFGEGLRSIGGAYMQGPLYDRLGSFGNFGQSRSEAAGLERPNNIGRTGSVVSRGFVGDVERPGVSGIPEPRSRTDRIMSGIAEGARNTQGASSTEEWLGPSGQRGGRGGSLMRSGSVPLGRTQMLGSEISLREHMAAQQRRPNQEY